jgi:hypothetical protein
MRFTEEKLEIFVLDSVFGVIIIVTTLSFLHAVLKLAYTISLLLSVFGTIAILGLTKWLK